MANEEHLARLKQGVKAWNQWREANPEIRQEQLTGADLTGADLSGAHLTGANLLRADFTRANLSGAHLTQAYLVEANFTGADLSGANLIGANLSGADLVEANFTGADLRGVNLTHANFAGAHLTGAILTGADLSGANLIGAHLIGAILSGANLTSARLIRADLTGANLIRATLVQTNFTGANLIGCSVYGISAWNMTLIGAKQADLVITPSYEPAITVDNLEVAQFIYLLLHNEKIREVIDTITSKVVLILGRFTEERKAVLEAIREELRRRNFIPVLFDFDKPASKDVTGTVETLARMARFIIADLTDPSSIPHELATVVPFLRTTPVLPLRLAGSGGYSMFSDLRAYTWVLETYEYKDGGSLISALPEIIAPADKMADKLRNLP